MPDDPVTRDDVPRLLQYAPTPEDAPMRTVSNLRKKRASRAERRRPRPSDSQDRQRSANSFVEVSPRAKDDRP